MRNGIIVAAVGTVVGGLILSFIPPLYDLFVGVISWIGAGISWIWTALLSDHLMPGWMFLIVGLLALIGVAAVCVIAWLSIWPKVEPTYVKYTEDMLYGAKWRWSWTGGTISDLWCFCPNCDAQLIYEEFLGQTHFICERCSPDGLDHRYRSHGQVVATVTGGNRYYAVSAAEREILRRIRTGERVGSSG